MLVDLGPDRSGGERWWPEERGLGLLRMAQQPAVQLGLVEAGISVYSLRQTQASLEDWFLSVTSRLGEEQ